MSGVDHQGQGKCLQWIECSKEQIDGDEFHGTGENGQAHQAGIPETKTGHLHIDSIGHSEEQETCEDRDRMRECASE